MTTDRTTLKTIIEANMQRLTAAGLPVTAFDVAAAFARARDRKISEAFNGLFSGLSLEELGIAAGVVDELLPPLVPPQSSTADVTPPTPEPVPSSKKRKKLWDRLKKA